MNYNVMPTFTPEEILEYLRKSRTDDPLKTVEEVLQNHEQILDEWSMQHLGAKVPKENKFREVVSGETLKERPEIQKILKLIESPKIKAVKVVEPQRLTRGDLEDIGRLMKLLKHTNTYVITPQRIYDLRDEYDWDAFERELKRGNDYLEYTKKILNRGKLLSVSQGNYISSIPPYGYKRVKVKDGKKMCPTLEEVPEEADVVRLIFNLYAKGYGRQAICNKLDEMKIKPPRTQYWKEATLKDILQNVHYIGKVRWNWRKTVTIVEQSEFVKTRPMSKVGEYLVYNGKHKAIVSEELFYTVQERFGNNPRVTKKKKVANVFNGLLRCQCGRLMTLRSDGKKNSAPRLVCPEQKHCGNGSCKYGEMLDRIIYILKECIEDFEIRLENDEGNSLKLHTNLIKNLEKKLAELEKKEIAQWEKQADPDESQRMPPHIFKILNEKLLKEKEEIKEALCKAYESMPEPIDYEEKKATFHKALDALKKPDIDPLKANLLLKECIESIDYKRERPQRTKGLQGTQWTSPKIEIEVKLKI